MNEFKTNPEALKPFMCSMDYHRYQKEMLITAGAKALADDFQCYWFLDVICSYQPIWEKERSVEPFQVWTLQRYEETDACLITCPDGNDKLLCKQEIPFTDFKPMMAVLWVEDDVILLPSEH